MSQSVRITKSSLKASKTCHDGLLLGLLEERELCRGCRMSFDLPVKKKPQSELGICLYGCLLLQEDGFPLLSTANTDFSSERKSKHVYCHLMSTLASTKHALPFSSSELSSSCRGHPSMKTAIEDTRACYSTQVAYYKNASRKKDAEKVRMQEELDRTLDKLARVQDKCNLLENDVRTL